MRQRKPIISEAVELDATASALPPPPEPPDAPDAPDGPDVSVAPVAPNLVSSSARPAGATGELGGRLAGLSLARQVYLLAIWPLLEQVLNFCVGFVDTALAGHLSLHASNAIGVAAYVGWLMGLVQSAVGIGATAIIARAVGGRYRRVANAALGQAVLLALGVGLVMGSLVWLLIPWVASLAGLTGPSLDLCVLYLRTLAWASPASAVLFVGGACLRGAGDTRTPFVVLLIVNGVNTVVSVLLVAGPAGIGGQGVLGIAVGTSAAWYVGAALTMGVLIHGLGGMRLRWVRLRPHAPTCWRIVRVGLPNLVEMLLAMWVANFAVLMIVGHVGRTLNLPGAWGAHMIAIRVEALSYLPGFAMGIAAATLTGQYLGAGDPERARRSAILCWKLGAGMMGLMGLWFMAWPQPLIRLATDEPELLATAPTLLRMAGFVQVFFATSIVLGQAMRGAGDTRSTLLLTAASTYAVRLPLVYLFAVPLGWGLIGVWMGLCTELAVRGCLFAWRFGHGDWLRAKV